MAYLARSPKPDRETESDAPGETWPAQEFEIGEQSQRPQKDKRYIGRDDAGGEDDAASESNHQARPECDALAIQFVRDEEDEQRGSRMQDRRWRADAGFAAAANAFGDGNRPGQKRRLGEISEGEFARPDPILRFVEIEIGERITQSDQPDQSEARNDQETQRKS